jgi:hypothetical protein
MEELKEKIRKFLEELEGPYFTTVDARNVASDILALLPQWVSARDGLPKEEGKYIVGYANGGKNYVSKDYIIRHKMMDIIWYGPLPTPPKEEN